MAFWKRPGFQRRWDSVKRGWYKFSKNPVSVVGLFFVLLVSFLAAFAPYVAPYPEHAGRFVNFSEASQPPSLKHPFGTDVFGRDILSRVFFGFRYSLMMGVVVLLLVVPPGVVLGLLAGYYRGTWIDTVIMRITDVFLAVPPLILALAVCSVLTPSVFNAMMAVSLMWWPWYTRLVYGLASSIRNEFFVQAAEVAGASRSHILFREILPNCVSSIFTKMSLDMGWVILIGSSLSFVGLGAQPPTPDLGTMVADGAKYLPDQWWIAVFPALAIMITVLGFNLIGDGLRDLFALEEV
ncbi:MAG: D,D-dipeptide ABC transport system permease protein DppC [Acetothermia bacterium 64_32]|nr:MAG: D,D-dipeptide ABC transport system permease protein DppC [Acetothermia bacterium 64_32]HAF70731.1 D,D-dipeptide ABC transporter permease [Candidatus Acetothermia bacterium]